MDLHVRMYFKMSMCWHLVQQKYRQKMGKMPSACVCVCTCVVLYERMLLFPAHTAKECNAMGETEERKATDMKGVSERRGRDDTGERENQPALTQRQSISSLLSLFPMGWPG